MMNIEHSFRFYNLSLSSFSNSIIPSIQSRNEKFKIILNNFFNNVET